ncbi:target of rapamycin complex subunit LST8-like isoform X2 [Papaver somniferum]|uniref:target of rapamycin complex subunit LST8-like isoform X2 n=1 Tax=Papaver somniferum TaxID=3469 RepID=UPI000E6F8328|nr:target of rapamycin complex subunit LST8-like isoform X2 [Papaver somniferum]
MLFVLDLKQFALAKSDSKGSLSIFKNGDRRLVPAAYDEIMEVWKNCSRSAILVPEVDMSIRSLTVIWDGSLVVAANNNVTCYVWRLQRGTQTMKFFELLHNLQAHDGYILKCLLSPGQIARVAIIFRVDEVVIFDNNNGSDYDLRLAIKEDADGNESGT